MHIPDGFLSGRALAGTAITSAAALGTALVQTRRMPARRVPLMGLSAAFVFAAQMLNFPIPGGTSGHLIGGVLTSVLLGPSAAILVLCAVLMVQCFLFADGGMLALGANVLNMGVIDAVAGYYIYRTVRRLIPGDVGRFAGVAFASWCGAVLAATVCAGELAVSGISARVVFPAMVNVHMIIGLGEALITTLVIFAIWQTRPELLEATPGSLSRGFAVTPLGKDAASRQENRLTGFASWRGMWEFIFYGLIISAALALFVSPFASESPDGLDRVSELLGFDGRAVKEPAIRAPIPDYALLPHFFSKTWAKGFAGLIGTAVVFCLAWLLARILVARTSNRARLYPPVNP